MTEKIYTSTLEGGITTFAMFIAAITGAFFLLSPVFGWVSEADLAKIYSIKKELFYLLLIPSFYITIFLPFEIFTGKTEGDKLKIKAIFTAEILALLFLLAGYESYIDLIKT